MKRNRIWAVVWRHLVQLPQDVNQWTSMLFWPILDIALFGFVGLWLHEGTAQAGFHALLAGVTLWQFLTRINFDISLSLLEEAWAHNTINLFASPLSIYEWLCGVIMKGIILGAVTFFANAAFVWLAYGYNVFSIGLFLGYTTLQLFLSGLMLGLFGAALLLRWGPRIQTFVFIIGFIASPIAGAFYPVYVLPDWLENIAYTTPLAHIFEGLYAYIQSGVWPVSQMIYATLLNGIYIAVALAAFLYAYTVAKDYGLERLAD